MYTVVGIGAYVAMSGESKSPVAVKEVASSS